MKDDLQAWGTLVQELYESLVEGSPVHSLKKIELKPETKTIEVIFNQHFRTIKSEEKEILVILKQDELMERWNSARMILDYLKTKFNEGVEK